MRLRRFALLVTGLTPALVSADVFSLSGLQWSLRNANGSIAIPAKVPSQAHLDLLDARIITEPLLGINGASCCVNLYSSNDLISMGADFTQRWIVNDNWTYTADITPLTQNLAGDQTALLVFYGIDTIANIVSTSYMRIVHDRNRMLERRRTPGCVGQQPVPAICLRCDGLCSLFR